MVEVQMNKPLIIGVAGGTGSGKTTVSAAIVAAVGGVQVALLQHDAYYKDNAHLPMEQRRAVNYDHPDALENDLLIAHLRTLSAPNPMPIAYPHYDFANYVRLPEVDIIQPKPVLIVEGILIFAEPALRDLFDIKVYVDTEADIRFIRRLQRDLKERGRTVEQVIADYMHTVRPMHMDFVEPSKRYADVIIPRGGHNRVAVEMVVARVGRELAARGILDIGFQVRSYGYAGLAGNRGGCRRAGGFAGQLRCVAATAGRGYAGR
jgi:uridine kinase